MADDEKGQGITHIHRLRVMVKSASKLPKESMIGGKSDPFCRVSFKDPHGSGCSYMWSTREIEKNCDPVWNEEHSWLFFKPIKDDLKIMFEVWDVDPGKNDLLGQKELKLGQIDGKAKTLEGGKSKKSKSTLTVEAKQETLKIASGGMVDLDKALAGYVKCETVNGLQSIIEKIQKDNISNNALYAQKTEMKENHDSLVNKVEKLEKEYATVQSLNEYAPKAEMQQKYDALEKMIQEMKEQFVEKTQITEMEQKYDDFVKSVNEKLENLDLSETLAEYAKIETMNGLQNTAAELEERIKKIEEVQKEHDTQLKELNELKEKVDQITNKVGGIDNIMNGFKQILNDQQ